MEHKKELKFGILRNKFEKVFYRNNSESEAHIDVIFRFQGVNNLPAIATVPKKDYLPLVKRKKIILTGHGASGKDYLKNMLVKHGMKCEVSYTSREPREGETPGSTYHYVTEEEFIKKVYSGFFLQHNRLDTGHYYGTSKKEWDNNSVFIMTPNAIDKLAPEIRSEAFVIYLDIKEPVRRYRLKNRGDNEEKIKKRLLADAFLFDNFDNFDYIIQNEHFQL